MIDQEVMKIELGKLVPNTYNPRKRMGEKYLTSLKKSLKEDGQLQNLLVRPVGGGRYEIVAGMRRFLSMKKIFDDNFKVMCTVREMDDETAIIQSFKENVEREELNPIDEAGWFFKMLGLKDEQLFITKSGEKDVEERVVALPLPGEKNREVIQLAEKIGTTAHMIEDRLPLLALPPELQDLTSRTYLDELSENDVPLGIEKAKALARLRLIGNKDDAFEHMKSVWRKWGKEDAKFIDDQVTKILETYAENAEAVLRELDTVEKNLEKRVAELNGWVEKDVKNWLDPKTKDSVFASLPDELKDAKEGVEIPTMRAKKKDENDRDYANGIYDNLDELVMALTKNSVLEDAKDDLEVKTDSLKVGKRDLSDEGCVYCGSEMTQAAIQKRIDSLLEGVDKIADKIKAKDKVRNVAERIKRELGTLIRKFDDVSGTYLASLNKLLKAKKITEEDYKKRLEKFKLKSG